MKARTKSADFWMAPGSVVTFDVCNVREQVHYMYTQHCDPVSLRTSANGLLNSGHDIHVRGLISLRNATRVHHSAKLWTTYAKATVLSPWFQRSWFWGWVSSVAWGAPQRVWISSSSSPWGAWIDEAEQGRDESQAYHPAGKEYRIAGNLL